MRKIVYKEFENFGDFIDNLSPINVYFLSSKILYNKIKKNICFNKQDYGALEIILEDYMKRIDNNECKKHK